MRSMLFVALASSLIACAVDSNDPTGSTEQSVVIDNRLAANRLAANRLAANRLAANRLAANRLSANSLSLDPIGSADLIETPDGREVLTYIVGCAIEEGTTLVGTDSSGNTYEFFGEIGLAPKWIDHVLDHQGQGWVSACLFARVNAFNVAVPVSMRGNNSALAVAPDEQANWTLQEGAFFGNLFEGGTSINWNACRGHDDATAEDRVCALPDPANPGKTLCGFNDAGTCYDTSKSHARHNGACAAFSSKGYYVNCAFESHEWGHDHGQPTQPGNAHHDWANDGGHDCGRDHDGDGDGENGRFEQVITSYVHP